jgi:small multidrug resistance family-3 protein
MKDVSWFVLAAVLEIAGCFVFWQWARAGHSARWLLPGLALLAGFAWVLTRVDGIYIAAALLWLWIVEGRRPDAWDLTGAGICIAGALVILHAPRG